MNGSWFLVLRAAHVLLAALWLGAAFMLSVFVMPAVRDVGPGGGQFMQTLQRRKLHAFMALAATSRSSRGSGCIGGSRPASTKK